MTLLIFLIAPNYHFMIWLFLLYIVHSGMFSQKILIFIHPWYHCENIAGSQKQPSGTTNVLCDGWVNTPQLTGMKTLSEPCLDNILGFLRHFDIFHISHNADGVFNPRLCVV
jgi:hypothetical protein